MEYTNQGSKDLKDPRIPYVLKKAQIETLQPDFSTRSQWHKLTWQVWNGVEKLLTLGFASPRESHHHRFGDPSKLNSFKKSVSYHQFWLVFFSGREKAWLMQVFDFRLPSGQIQGSINVFNVETSELLLCLCPCLVLVLLWTICLQPFFFWYHTQRA